MSSNPSTLTFAGDATVVSEHGPDAYERTSYYNGITGDGDYPDLVYRSDFLTTPFPKPVGRHAHVPVKSLRGVFDTPLNDVWDAVGPHIRDLIKAYEIHWSSGPPGEEAKGSLGPVVIWVGIILGSTSPNTAHDVSQEILKLLLKNGVEDAVVEWREAVPQSGNATHHVGHFLTALLGVLLANEEMEEGTLTLWFHENKDKDGNPSNKVYGVSNCHVLRKHTNVDYEHRGGTPMDYVRLCGIRRFQRSLDITKAIADHGILADLWARDIVELQAQEGQNREDAREMLRIRSKLDDENEAIADLEALYDQVTKEWSNIKLHRNIGHVQYAEAITVDEDDTRYTSDGCRCLIVGKDGNATDLTVGRYAGLVLFTRNEVGIESVELGIYNSGVKCVEVFSAKGDSGSLVWHTKNGQARIVGQLHSGHNKGGSTSNHVTYCTPGWYLLKQIKKRFRHADFYRTTRSA
ncbi:hypothetical protein HETIRDRAFT_115919 [Heterobasidion irregulare TC 32-1]|uniref:Uncharacterized protein n=1 Tax=Heterobasidion irregulare (strain TC 32-1) TaxID=747525 RepID=W4K6N1_HETIT|nr:uncharacterized protein HETIRDRAFT_115919 [Heterobasidion irregulare TC 32-1]ETW80721.1 hypothetical protein HETIRDRAFT_115919 [Heterobasidion irregulare TC 32-1]